MSQECGNSYNNGRVILHHRGPGGGCMVRGASLLPQTPQTIILRELDDEYKQSQSLSTMSLTQLSLMASLQAGWVVG